LISKLASIDPNNILLTTRGVWGVSNPGSPCGGNWVIPFS